MSLAIEATATDKELVPQEPVPYHAKKRRNFALFSWLFWTIGALYLILPLWGTFIFSLQKERGTLSFAAYTSALSEPMFLRTFLFSNIMAFSTIFVSLLLVVPTAYWVQLRAPKWRPVVEFISLMPFVIPAIVLVFGLIKMYSRSLSVFGVDIIPPLTNSTMATNLLLVMAYTVLSLPYMYRSVDNGLRAMDVRTLTEAAQSLGAGWPTILGRIIFPNLRTALLSGALLTFAIVVGELTLASFLNRPAFGPYLALIGNHQTYEPAALAMVTFGLTWLAMVLINVVTGGNRGATVTGVR